MNSARRFPVILPSSCTCPAWAPPLRAVVLVFAFLLLLVCLTHHLNLFTFKIIWFEIKTILKKIFWKVSLLSLPPSPFRSMHTRAHAHPCTQTPVHVLSLTHLCTVHTHTHTESHTARERERASTTSIHFLDSFTEFLYIIMQMWFHIIFFSFLTQNVAFYIRCSSSCFL